MKERMYNYGTEYENGAAVRKLRPEWETKEVPKPRVVEQPQAQPKTRVGVDVFSVLVLLTAILLTMGTCIDYLQVQSDIVQLNKNITALESNIATLAKENNAVEAVLENEVCDLDYIYQMAVGVLGMVYPNQNEVITYSSTERGHVIQYQDIPE